MKKLHREFLYTADSIRQAYIFSTITL